MDRIAIFKTGHHAATSGETLDATADYVRAIAAAYDPALHEAPVFIGHPKDNAPAYGWVRALTFDEGSGTLYADLAQVEPQFAALLADGRFKKRSASIYDPDHPNNPTPGKPYLRHVGFLGAQPPAVKGLADFAAAAAPVYEFGDPAATPPPPTEMPMNEDELKKKEEELAAREKELADREAAVKRREEELAAEEAAREQAEADDYAEGLVKAGKLLPCEKAAVVSVLLTGKDATFDFAEGGKTVQKRTSDGIKAVLDRLPATVDFAERTPEDPNKRTLPQAGDGNDEDKAAAALEKKIQDFADKKGLTFAQAAAQFQE